MSVVGSFDSQIVSFFQKVQSRRAFRWLGGTVAMTIYIAIIFAVALSWVSPFGLKITLRGACTWGIAALVAFHSLLACKRSETTLNELRALEYIFIAIGLFGILGFADVQTVLVETQLKAWMASYAAIQPVTNLCGSPEEKSARQREIECAAESTLRGLLQDYNRDRARKFLSLAKETEREPFYPRIRGIVEFVRRMHNEMEQQVFKYTVDPQSESWLNLKLFGFYMILLGAAIKFAKTSAEILNWYVVKDRHHPIG